MTVSASSHLAPPPSSAPIVNPKDGMGTWNWIQWFVAARVKINAINTSLANLAGTSGTPGILVTDGNGNWFVRALAAGTNVTITDANGVAGDPTISASGGGGGGNAIYVNPQTGTYTLVLTDIPAASSYKGYIPIDSASAAQLIIPTNANVNFPIGSSIRCAQIGAGTVTITGASGVIFVGPSITGAGQGASGEAIQIATDKWVISGDLGYTFGAGTVQYLVVAGGGGGGYNWGGGGGAGGVSSGSLSVAPGVAINVVVGNGGAGATSNAVGSNGQDSSFDTITSTGGGGGGGNTGLSTAIAGANGGSGGGGGGAPAGFAVGGTGVSGQGFAGGSGVASSGVAPAGGGGGASAVGATATTAQSGSGGNGVSSSITGSAIIYGGGGGGGGNGGSCPAGSGGLGGGGAGSNAGAVAGTAGTANTGGGGGGGGISNGVGGDGGSGVVIISSPQPAASYTGSPVITTSGGNTIYTFNANGTITF